MVNTLPMPICFCVLGQRQTNISGKLITQIICLVTFIHVRLENFQSVHAYESGSLLGITFSCYRCNLYSEKLPFFSHINNSDESFMASDPELYLSLSLCLKTFVFALPLINYGHLKKHSGRSYSLLHPYTRGIKQFIHTSTKKKWFIQIMCFSLLYMFLCFYDIYISIQFMMSFSWINFLHYFISDSCNFSLIFLIRQNYY